HGADHAAPGQERGEVLGHRDRAHARPTAAVRDAEGLVQVEVAHVAAEHPGAGHADERVEVGAVDVHLAARRVYRVADVAHARLVHAVRGRVGDHQCGQRRAVLVDLGVQVVEVDV